MSNELIKKTHRRGWIDFARGIVIIYVVYRHALTGLISAGVDIRNAIFMVQESSMPVFFIVSGVFIGSSAIKRGLGTFIRFKFESLIYPFLIWGSIHLTLQILLSTYSNSEKNWSYFQYLFTYPRAVDQFWYLYTLFLVMALFATLNFWILKFKPIPNVLIGFSFYVISYFVSTDYFSLNDIFFYYSFLVFGFLMADSMLPIDTTFFKGKWLWYAIPIFVMLQMYWYIHYQDARFLVQLDFIGFLLFMPAIIIGALLLFVLAFVLEERNLFTPLKWIGSHSLYIYVMHLIFTSGVRMVLVRLFPALNPIVTLIIIILGGVFISIGVYQLLRKLKQDWLFEPPLFVKKLIFYGGKPQ